MNEVFIIMQLYDDHVGDVHSVFLREYQAYDRVEELKEKAKERKISCTYTVERFGVHQSGDLSYGKPSR